jgi:D-arabinose 1-dehydrogenase-like Zn-dependent alcohol dehydrogenase
VTFHNTPFQNVSQACNSDRPQVTARKTVAATSLRALTDRHEIVGVVTAVGAEVDTFKVGDLAGVGCMVDSCRKCVLGPGAVSKVGKHVTVFTRQIYAVHRPSASIQGFACLNASD